MATLDKSWMDIGNRLDPNYIRGVETFLDFAFQHTKSGNLIYCPCRKCFNGRLKTRDEVREDLIVSGILRGYTYWDFHGEDRHATTGSEDDELELDNEVECDEIDELIADTFPEFNHENVGDRRYETDTTSSTVPQNEAERILRVIQNAKTSIYPGCDISLLSFVLKLLHIKCVGGMSNKAFTMLLKELKKVFPKGEMLPKSYYEAKKIIQDLGHSYDKIDACINDCVLFRKEHAYAEYCPTCGESRWKKIDCGDNDDDEESTGYSNRRKRVSRKILRHFPLKPRLQKMFMSSKIASEMKWHHDNCIRDDNLSHPADSEAWKYFDQLYPDFSVEPRNVRLGLASDGFNPFSNMSLSYSMWPVVLIPYNLPPWICMKQTNMILSLLIPGERAPGNDIDIYLQPLIDELKELWEEGVDTFDASSKTTFQMRATLLWTISDFPGYAVLSGWSTKGRLACPVCNVETCSKRLVYGKKQCYMCHRRFLPLDHKWRDNKRNFDGNKELRPPPLFMSGDDILKQMQDVEQITFGKGKKQAEGSEHHNWKKKSIFFALPYWKNLLIRHNLDVMHIEKNVCDNVIATLLGVSTKTKDNLNSRLDLQHLKLREELHPIKKDENTYLLPPARYTLSSDEKSRVLQILKDIKVPDGFSSNISRCVNLKEKRLIGLKSHDCHVLLQRLLPLAIRGILPDDVCDALLGLSSLFVDLCSKTLRVEELKQIERNAAITLCRLEMLFPPSFFDVMVHLPIHLANEVKIAGPVQYRWMYPIERYVYFRCCKYPQLGPV